MTATLIRRQTTPLDFRQESPTPTGQYEFFREWSRMTTWLVTNEIDPLIRDTVARWDLTSPAAQISWVISDAVSVSQEPIASNRKAIDTIEDLSKMLRLPVLSIIGAAGIADRTFYDWKRSARNPRVSSLGRLWMLVQLIEDLATVHQDVAMWLHARPAAMSALLAGDFDSVTSYDLAEKNIVGLRQSMAFEAIGPEPDLPVTTGTPLNEYKRVGRSGRQRKAKGGSAIE